MTPVLQRANGDPDAATGKYPSGSKVLCDQLNHSGAAGDFSTREMVRDRSCSAIIRQPPSMSFWGRVKDNVMGVDDGVESAGEFTANLLNKGGQGLMFGFGDEADAGVRSLVHGKSYHENLANYREREQQFERDHPVASTVAEIGGAMLPVALGVGAGVQTVRGGAALGAGMGGLHGFGNGEGGAQNRAEQSALGMLLGGVIGAAVPAAGNKIRDMANNYSTRKGAASRSKKRAYKR